MRIALTLKRYMAAVGERDEARAEAASLRARLDVCAEAMAHLSVERDVAVVRAGRVESVLRRLVERCDGAEGVRADGSNVPTLDAHAVLGDLVKEAS